MDTVKRRHAWHRLVRGVRIGTDNVREAESGGHPRRLSTNHYRASQPALAWSESCSSSSAQFCLQETLSQLVQEIPAQPIAPTPYPDHTLHKC